MKISKSIKFLTAIILLCATLLPAFTVFACADMGTSFVDVNKKSWYYDSVYYCQIKGYINGVGDNRFDPHGSITREQFVTILANISYVDTDKYKYIPCDMRDVSTGRWYSGAITWAVQEGYVSGISKELFGLGRNIDRASLAALLYRYAKKNGNVTAVTADLSKYSDYSKVQPWMEEGLKWAVANSIITSTGSTELILDPLGTATRAQTSVMLRAFDKAKGCAVGLNRQALTERITADHSKFKPDLIKRIPYEAYLTITKEPVPEQCKYIYDWFIDIILNKDSEYSDNIGIELTLKDPEDYNVFSEYSRSCTDLGYTHYGRLDENGNYTALIVVREKLMDSVYYSYNTYAARLDKINKEIKETPDLYLYDADAICNDVEEMVIASGAVGKLEKEAVNCIINYLCDKYEYDYDTLMGLCSSGGRTISYGYLNNRVISEGYAKTFYAICYYLGLDVEYCRGTTNTGIPYAWNKITLNDGVYYFDITRHDDCNSTNRPTNDYIWAAEDFFEAEYVYEDSSVYIW